ncbi:hypothetical protein NKG99_04150 [Mesorhizobium sp. M1409]|uniref:hypothetical protein n=1 Tax=Mesorhizobium sp. M1409 TaxID=2957100 RepID=UPI003335D18B
MSKLLHGHTRRLQGGGRVDSPEYRAYAAMKTRCLNRRQDRFADYGGRGIKVCDRWLTGDGARTGFECFFSDLGPKPTPAHSLERRENEGGYEPSNCRWATAAEQNRNTRQNRHLYICGVVICLADAASFTADSPSAATINRRIGLGWTAEDAVLTPVGHRPIAGMEVCF